MSSIALACVLFAYSGLGLQLLTAERLVDWRRIAAEYFFGFTAYSTLFTLAALMRLSAGQVAAILLGFAALGGALIVVSVARFRADLRRRSAVAFGVAGLHALVSLYPFSDLPRDPYHYALLATAAFHRDWFDALPAQGGLTEVKTIVEAMPTRAAAIAPLWPGSALSGSTTLTDVYSVAALLTLATAVALADTLTWPRVSWARLALSVSALGAFQLGSVVVGQINQAFALTVVVSTIWLFRHTRSGLIQAPASALAGALLITGYPEFLLVLPVYWLTAIVIGAVGMRQAGVCLGLGGVSAVAVSILSRASVVDYLLVQSGAAPQFTPLNLSAVGLVEVLAAVVYQSSVRFWPAITVLLVVLALFAPLRVSKIQWRECAPFCMMGLLIAGVASTALLSGNPNYSAWKVSAWLGPALLLLVCVAAGRSRLASSRFALAGLVIIVIARLNVASTFILRMPLPSETPAWTLQVSPASCELEVRSAQITQLFRAISESGAPTRGCGIRAPDEK